MSDATQTDPGWLPPGPSDGAAGRSPRLVIAWSLAEPHRVGESFVLPRSGEAILGRGGERDDDPAPRLLPRRLRPFVEPPLAPLGGPGLSRVQLAVRVSRGVASIENRGRGRLLVEGKATERATLAIGDRIQIDRQLVLFVAPSAEGQLAPNGPAPFAFGEPDAFGMVGESPVAYGLRDRLVFVGRRAAHVLLSGPSGAGKELCARAVHALSNRHLGPFVARSAVTLPAGLLDAELFGHAKNYPNAGMRERDGLVGEAHRGTLFLDEIGELPEELQAHLLRVLDRGEYHRLGDARTAQVDLRFVGATNREEGALKHDLAARLALRIDVPGLDERREDIPLLARALLRGWAESDPELRQRFFAGDEPRLDPALVVALLGHRYATHVRELGALLLASMGEATEDFLPLSPSVEKKLAQPAMASPSKEEIVAALAEADGNVSRAYKDLGLPNRDALRRLLKKHALG